MNFGGLSEFLRQKNQKPPSFFGSSQHRYQLLKIAFFNVGIKLHQTIMEGRFLDRFSSTFELDLPPNLQTMKEYIEFIVPKIQAWSEDLRETHYWLNKSWLEIHDSDGWDRTFIHIFMDDGEHFMSDNGVVSRSNWQTLPKSNSLILNEGRATILYDLVFLNSDMMILKQNGTSRYFVLGAERFVKGRIRHDWRAGMEELYNIYRNNSKFSVYVFGLVAVIIIFLVLTLT